METYFQSLARAARELFTIDVKFDIKFHQCRETLEIKSKRVWPTPKILGKMLKKKFLPSVKPKLMLWVSLGHPILRRCLYYGYGCNGGLYRNPGNVPESGIPN